MSDHIAGGRIEDDPSDRSPAAIRRWLARKLDVNHEEVTDEKTLADFEVTAWDERDELAMDVAARYDLWEHRPPIVFTAETTVGEIVKLATEATP